MGPLANSPSATTVGDFDKNGTQDVALGSNTFQFPAVES
jgi:hypothetical protein